MDLGIPSADTDYFALEQGSTEVLIVVNKLGYAPYQLITSGLKQFSVEAITTLCLFKKHNHKFYSFMVRRRNLQAALCGIYPEKLAKKIKQNLKN